MGKPHSKGFGIGPEAVLTFKGDPSDLLLLSSHSPLEGSTTFQSSAPRWGPSIEIQDPIGDISFTWWS